MIENYQRRTKIVATLGPATDRDDNLEQIIIAGANVLRLNLSHGVPDDHLRRATEAREIAARLGKSIAILGDLQGPKIRISTFKDGKVKLVKGEKFILDANLGRGEGTSKSIGIDYKELPKDVVPGDVLLLDDGRVILEVISTNGVQVDTVVIFGGELSDKKGINKRGGGLTAPALTDKDKEDIVLASKIGVDYLAVSFPRSGADMRYAKSLVDKAGFNPKLVAKVERAEAVATDEAMMDLIESTDVIMVARGDLGVEIGDPRLASIQKRLIKLTRLAGKVVITATQMMETMIKSPMPTRAEVMDVSNAIIDGTDAVMLSGETANGDFPREVVEKMSEIAIGAESLPHVKTQHTLIFDIGIDEEGVAKQAVLLANSLKDVAAIVCLTSSGNTALYASRIKSSIPIYSFAKKASIVALMSLYRGVYPQTMHADIDSRTHQGAMSVIQNLKDKGLLKVGDKVVLTQGDTEMKSTNVIRVITVH